MSKEQLLAKYNVDQAIWKNASRETVVKWIKWFRGVQE